jgi:hypothetical protein
MRHSLKRFRLDGDVIVRDGVPVALLMPGVVEKFGMKAVKREIRLWLDNGDPLPELEKEEESV